MGPIEVMWGIIVLIFIMISFVRGYNRELGSTAIILVGLVALKLLEMPITAALKALPGGPNNMLSMIVFQAIFIAIVFAGYSGETLSFRGQPRKGSAFFFNFTIGLLNGILVVGTLWYYMDLYKYPLPKSMFDAALLTDFARKAPQYLPPKLPSQALVGLLILLLILRVRK